MGAPHDEALAGGAAQGSKAYETTDAAIVAPETIGGKKVHPAANLFPLLNPESDQYKKLALSIKHNQQFEPIVLDSEDRILDGRNRMRVCIELGIEPRVRYFHDLGLVNKDGKPVDAAEYAYEKNIARRDLTDDQRVMIVALYREYLDKIDRGAPKGNKNAAKKQGDQVVPTKAEPKTRAKVAAKAGVSERKAQQALNVGRKKPDLAKKVAAGNMKLSDAAKQAEPKKPKQQPMSRAAFEMGTRAAVAHEARQGKPAPAQLELAGLPAPIVEAKAEDAPAEEAAPLMSPILSAAQSLLFEKTLDDCAKELRRIRNLTIRRQRATHPDVFSARKALLAALHALPAPDGAADPAKVTRPE